MYSLMQLCRFAYQIIPQLRSLLIDGQGAHLVIALESVGHYQ